MSPEAQTKDETPAAPEPEEQPAAAKPIAKATPLTQSRFGLADEYRKIWCATCEESTTPEQLMEQSYWANLAMMMQPRDRIVVAPDSLAWELHLRVIGCGKLWAHVAKLEFYDWEAVSAPEQLPSRYTVKHAGAHHKWRFLRDGVAMKDGFETEALARRAAANHEMAVNRTNR